MIKKFHLPHWLVALLLFTFILRIPSFFEPFSYGDEMIYLTLGQGIKQGLTLYKDIHDNKPPLLYFLAAIAGNVFWFRTILAAWMTITTIIFWRFIKKLFPKESTLQIIATTVFAILTTIPLLEGQISNAELFMIGPTIAAFHILLFKKPAPKNLFSAGVLFSFATLFKMPAVFDMGTIIFLWVIVLKPKKAQIMSFIKNTLILTAGFVTPIAITIIYYALKGALQEYLVAAFLQNIGYLSSWRPEVIKEPFLTKNAPLLARAGIVLFGLSTLYFFRKKLRKSFIFTTAWLLFTLFAVTLSERPYPHYLIQAVPPIAILVGILLAKKSIEQSLAIIPLFLALLAPVTYKFWHYPTLPYYQRFILFATGIDSKKTYFDKFDSSVNRNYQIAEFISSSTKPSEKIFVWGNSSPVYALSRRLPPIKYVATYHINDFYSQSALIKDLTQHKPSLIIILPNSPNFPTLQPFLHSHYIQVSSINGASIWRYLNPVVMNSIR